MNTDMIWQIASDSSARTELLGELLGTHIDRGLVIELVSDVGGGKTTLTRGLARGLGVTNVISSPTFTISRKYSARDGLELQHFDLYRLDDPGIIAMELQESLTDDYAVIVIEWADSLDDILPDDRLSITLEVDKDGGRLIIIRYKNSDSIVIQKVKKSWDGS